MSVNFGISNGQLEKIKVQRRPHCRKLGWLTLLWCVWFQFEASNEILIRGNDGNSLGTK